SGALAAPPSFPTRRSPNLFDLSGKKALVPGASGGIGGAIVGALHGQGAIVALSGTKLAALEELAGSLGERPHTLPADLSDPAARSEEHTSELQSLTNLVCR